MAAAATAPSVALGIADAFRIEPLRRDTPLGFGKPDAADFVARAVTVDEAFGALHIADTAGADAGVNTGLAIGELVDTAADMTILVVVAARVVIAVGPTPTVDTGFARTLARLGADDPVPLLGAAPVGLAVEGAILIAGAAFTDDARHAGQIADVAGAHPVLGAGRTVAQGGLTAAHLAPLVVGAVVFGCAGGRAHAVQASTAFALAIDLAGGAVVSGRHAGVQSTNGRKADLTIVAVVVLQASDADEVALPGGADAWAPTADALIQQWSALRVDIAEAIITVAVIVTFAALPQKGT